MKRLLVMLWAVFICSLCTWSQYYSVAAIGKTVTQCNDFAYAKTMLKKEGLTYDAKFSTASHARFRNADVAYADEALIVDIYKKKGTKKVEKCVLSFGERYVRRLSDDLSRHGYTYTSTARLSIEPFRELWECNELAVGMYINDKGWFVATFFRWGQGVKF